MSLFRVPSSGPIPRSEMRKLDVIDTAVDHCSYVVLDTRQH